MTAESSWDALRELRARGKFPKLVIITNVHDMPLRGGSVFVIDHEPIQPVPVHLLEDLNVVFWFDQCCHARQAAHEIQIRRLRLKSACVTCHCAGSFNPAPYPSCEEAAALCDWEHGGS